MEFCLVASFPSLANCSLAALAGIAGVPATALPLHALQTSLVLLPAGDVSSRGVFARSSMPPVLEFHFYSPPSQISNIVVMHASSHIVAKRILIVCGFSQRLGFISSVRRPSVGERRGSLFFPVSLEALLWQKNCFHLQVGHSRHEKLSLVSKCFSRALYLSLSLHRFP